MITADTHINVAEPATISAAAPLEATPLTTVGAGPEVLSSEEWKLLRAQEEVLKSDRGRLAVSKALYTIDKKRLFRGHANSMCSYGALWGYSRGYTSRLIKSGQIIYELELYCPAENIPLPICEWQVRPLARLEHSSERLAAWKEAVMQSQGDVPTSVVVAECVGGKPSRPIRKSRQIPLRLDLERVPGLAQHWAQEASSLGLTQEQLGLIALARYLEHPISAEVSNALWDLSIAGFI